MHKEANPTEETRNGSSVVVPLLIGFSAFFVAALIGLAGRWAGVPLAELVRDPASQFGYPAYGGLLSHLGILLLAATAAIAGFVAYLCRTKPAGRLLLAVAFLSAVFTFDDLFLLHERLETAGQAGIFVLYGLLVVGIAVYARRHLSRHDWSGLLVVIGFLGLSALIDLTAWRGTVKSALEDFSKFGGYAAWLAVWASFAKTILACDPEDHKAAWSGKARAKASR
ncbi:MAG: hypothetical protein AAF919_09140 [Pseudomonadota bacterium]